MLVGKTNLHINVSRSASMSGERTDNDSGVTGPELRDCSMFRRTSVPMTAYGLQIPKAGSSQHDNQAALKWRCAETNS